MRIFLLALLAGMTFACATVDGGERSKLSIAAEKTAQDLLAVGKEFARAGAREACVVVVRNALDALKEVGGKYSSLLPSAESFCDVFFIPDGAEEPAQPERPEGPKGPEVRL